MNKSFCEQSIDTQMIVEKIVEMQMGDTVTYDVFSELIGRNVRDPHDGRNTLERARRIAERDYFVFTDCVPTEGIKRITESQAVKSRPTRMRRKMSKAARRLIKTLHRIKDSKLTREEVTERNTALAHAGALVMFNKPQAVEAVARVNDQSLPGAAILDALRNIE